MPSLVVMVLLVMALTSCGVAGGSSSVAAKDTLVVGVSKDQPGLGLRQPDGTFKGFDIDTAVRYDRYGSTTNPNSQASAASLLEGFTTTDDTGTRRLYNPQDFVRQEVVAALQTRMATLRLGEETGQLPTLSGRVAEFYEEKLQRQLDRVVAIIGPAAIILISVVVGGLIVSVMTALLSVTQVVG